MARTKSKTKKIEAPVSAPAAPVTEKAVAPAEIKEETVPAAETPAASEAPAVEAKETKAASKKKAAPAKSEAPKKEEVFVIQSSGKDYTMDDIKEACKAAFRNGTRKQVKTCDVYLKAENDGLRAYYVINGNADGAYIDL
ncbi:MAG: DUF6465 family protein [Huintestinicola sp.]